jgi:hypothetical protein
MTLWALGINGLRYMRRDMTIFVYLRSGLPERQGSKMASTTGKVIVVQSGEETRSPIGAGAARTATIPHDKETLPNFAPQVSGISNKQENLQSEVACHDVFVLRFQELWSSDISGSVLSEKEPFTEKGSLTELA